jgi:hypothetical protein
MLPALDEAERRASRGADGEEPIKRSSERFRRRMGLIQLLELLDFGVRKLDRTLNNS